MLHRMEEVGARGAVFIVTPGGLEEPGGIGRIATSETRYWRERGAGPPLRVLDPYGRRGGLLSLLWLARVLVQLAWSAWRGRVALVHVNMATRGSAVRKGIVVHACSRLGLPVLLHLHAKDAEAFTRRLAPRARLAFARIFERADLVAVLGERQRCWALELVRAPPRSHCRTSCQERRR